MHKTNLRKYFPMLKTKDEIINIINNSSRLQREFGRWNQEQQEAFLNFCSGAKGVKMLYDSFFKEVLDPEATPERLNWLLSVILGMKVTIVKVLPLDTTRMGGETSMVVMDIVVELEDGSLVNVEMQKIGYLFPGQRSACYSADLLLRQYKRIRSAHNKNKTKFKYSDIKPVYTIVFFENSPKEFKAYPNHYIHYSEQVTDTGLKIELLQKYIFIPLDIFRQVRQNNSIDSELDAWLTFLSSDDIEDIMQLIEQYPAFKPLYETLYQMCENIEEVMHMFSKELYEFDKNTCEFMVDEYSKTIEEQEATIIKLTATIEKLTATIEKLTADLAERDKAFAEMSNAFTQMTAELTQLKAQKESNN